MFRGEAAGRLASLFLGVSSALGAERVLASFAWTVGLLGACFAFGGSRAPCVF